MLTRLLLIQYSTSVHQDVPECLLPQYDSSRQAHAFSTYCTLSSIDDKWRWGKGAPRPLASTWTAGADPMYSVEAPVGSHLFHWGSAPARLLSQKYPSRGPPGLLWHQTAPWERMSCLATDVIVWVCAGNLCAIRQDAGLLQLSILCHDKAYFGTQLGCSIAATTVWCKAAETWEVHWPAYAAMHVLACCAQGSVISAQQYPKSLRWLEKGLVFSWVLAYIVGS